MPTRSLPAVSLANGFDSRGNRAAAQSRGYNV